MVISWWWVIVGQKKGLSSLGWSQYGHGGVLGVGMWHVDGTACPWPGISSIIRVKGLISEKATAALNKAGVVRAPAPLGCWLL